MERSSKKGDVKRETRTNAQDEPAKVYRPRTMAPKSVNPDTESDTPKPRVENTEEPVKKRSYTPREKSDSIETDSEKSSEKPRKARRDSDTEQGGEKSYKPRTLKPRNSDDIPFRDRFSPEKTVESSEKTENNDSFESKPKRFEDREDRPRRERSINRPERSGDRDERPSKNRFSDRPSRSEKSDDRSGSKDRFVVKKSDNSGESRERSDRFASKPRRFEKSDDRKERTDRYGSKPNRSDDSEKASGYKPRTFTKKSDDNRISESKPRKEFSKPEKLEAREDGLVRLNKYIANSGLCSRREADEYIQSGQISVNGEVVTQLGTRVNPQDEIRYKGKELESENRVYILINKPKDYVTTVEDPHAKRTVMDLIDGACPERVYPVGRLDRNSTGVLLLTNDGEMTKRLTHPSFMKKKIYHVELDKKVSVEDLEKIRQGVEVDGEILKVDAIDYTEESNGTEVGVEIHTGQNRVVRRIFESLFYRVVKLDRVYFAGLTKKNLPRGKWRFLTLKEVNMLKMNRF